MSNIHIPQTPTAGLPPRENQIPEPYGGRRPRLAPPKNLGEKQRTNPLIAFPERDSDDEECVCRRGED